MRPSHHLLLASNFRRRSSHGYYGTRHRHTLRHSFSTHLVEAGYDIRTVQELLAHKDIRMAMVYTHVLNKPGRGVQSPADSLPALQDNAPSVIMQDVQDKQ